MRIHKIGNYLQAFSSVISAGLLFLLALTVLFQIVAREIFKIPCTWTEEVMKFSFFWSAMLGASILVRKQRHFSVNILADAIKNKNVHRAITILGYVSILFVACCLFFYGIRFARMGIDKFSSVLRFKMVWIYSSIPVSALLMIYYAAELLLMDLGIIPRLTTEEMDMVSLYSLLKKATGRD